MSEFITISSKMLVERYIKGEVKNTDHFLVYENNMYFTKCMPAFKIYYLYEAWKKYREDGIARAIVYEFFIRESVGEVDGYPRHLVQAMADITNPVTTHQRGYLTDTEYLELKSNRRKVGKYKIKGGKSKPHLYIPV